MCNFNCKIRLQTFQMFLTKLKQKYKKIELLKNFCKNQIGFLQSQNYKKKNFLIKISLQLKIEAYSCKFHSVVSDFFGFYFNFSVFL